MQLKLSYIVSHPIQYQIPLLNKLAALGSTLFKVYFLTDITARHYVDSGFKTQIKWDIPLMDGYANEVLPCWGDNEKLTFFKPVIYTMTKIIKKDKNHVVWFHGYGHYAMIWGMILCKFKRIPFLFRSESNLQVTSQGYIKDKLVRWIIKNAAGLLWIGKANKEYYEYYGAGAQKLFFVPYTVDNEYFQNRINQSKGEIADLKMKLRIKNEFPVILYASKFIKRKHPQTLLKAFIQLSKDDITPPPACLIFVGDGEERPALEKQIHELGWGNHVQITGFKNQSELPLYYALCDIFVLPSEQEPYGLVINEVMNAGKPVITTNQVGAAFDLVEHGKNGFIIEPGNIDELYNALQTLIASPDIRLKMGKCSKEKIEKWSYKEDVTGILSALEYVNSQDKL